MARELKLWNGRCYCLRRPNDPLWDNVASNASVVAYVAAYSRADARRLCAEYCGRDPGETEIRDYWSAGQWGVRMAGVTPERGIWIRFGQGRDTPIRVI